MLRCWGNPRERPFVLILAVLMLMALAACGGTVEPGTSQNETASDAENPVDESLGSNEPTQPRDMGDTSDEPESGEDENAMTNITITVGSAVFSAKLYDNDTANALLAKFPMTLNMFDLNGNEKYYYLAGNLPSDSAESPATINAGDIMCWSGNCLVLFYEAFSNSYGGYVRLGYVEDTAGLADALAAACRLRLIEVAPDGKSFMERINSINGTLTLDHAAKTGLGSLEYDLMSIDN